MKCLDENDFNKITEDYIINYSNNFKFNVNEIDVMKQSIVDQMKKSLIY
jgi:hypothetical protein